MGRGHARRNARKSKKSRKIKTDKPNPGLRKKVTYFFRAFLCNVCEIPLEMWHGPSLHLCSDVMDNVQVFIWLCSDGHGHGSGQDGATIGSGCLGNRIGNDGMQLVVIAAQVHRLLVPRVWLLVMTRDHILIVTVVAVVAVVVGIHTAATYATANTGAMAHLRRGVGCHALTTLVAPRLATAHGSIAGPRRRHGWGRKRVRRAAGTASFEGPGYWARDLHNHGSRDWEPQWITLGQSGTSMKRW